MVIVHQSMRNVRHTCTNKLEGFGSHFFRVQYDKVYAPYGKALCCFTPYTVFDSNIMTSDRDIMTRVLQKILSDMREHLSKQGYHEDYFKGMELAEGVAIMIISGSQASEVEA